MKTFDRRVELKILAVDKGINNDKLLGNKVTSNSFPKAMTVVHSGP